MFNTTRILDLGIPPLDQQLTDLHQQPPAKRRKLELTTKTDEFAKENFSNVFIDPCKLDNGSKTPPPNCLNTPPNCQNTPPNCQNTPPNCQNTPPNCQNTPPNCENTLLFAQIKPIDPPLQKNRQFQRKKKERPEFIKEISQIRDDLCKLKFEKIKNFTLSFPGSTFHVTKHIKSLGSGHYNEAHLIMGNFEDEQTPKEYVLKLPLNDFLKKPNNLIEETFQNDKKGYKIIKERFKEENSPDFRVATFYDLEKDLESEQQNPKNPLRGWHIVEYVKGDIPKDLKEKTIDNVIKLSQFACKNKDLPLDFKKDNCKLGKDGEIVLIDPVQPQWDEFSVLKTKAINSFTTDKDSELYKELKEALGMSQPFTEAIGLFDF